MDFIYGLGIGAGGLEQFSVGLLPHTWRRRTARRALDAGGRLGRYRFLQLCLSRSGLTLHLWLLGFLRSAEPLAEFDHAVDSLFHEVNVLPAQARVNIQVPVVPVQLTRQVAATSEIAEETGRHEHWVVAQRHRNK